MQVRGLRCNKKVTTRLGRFDGSAFTLCKDVRFSGSFLATGNALEHSGLWRQLYLVQGTILLVQ